MFVFSYREMIYLYIRYKMADDNINIDEISKYVTISILTEQTHEKQLCFQNPALVISNIF